MIVVVQEEEEGDLPAAAALFGRVNLKDKLELISCPLSLSLTTIDLVMTDAAGVSSALPADSVNPYAGHRLLSEKEQQVLGEYARLAATIKRVSMSIPLVTRVIILHPRFAKVSALSSNLSSSERHTSLLNDLRVLERKMGLVLTLFKASVWSLIQTHQDELEEEEQRRQQQDDTQYSNYQSTTEQGVDDQLIATHQEYPY